MHHLLLVPHDWITNHPHATWLSAVFHSQIYLPHLVHINWPEILFLQCLYGTFCSKEETIVAYKIMPYAYSHIRLYLALIDHVLLVNGSFSIKMSTNGLLIFIMTRSSILAVPTSVLTKVFAISADMVSHRFLTSIVAFIEIDSVIAVGFPLFIKNPGISMENAFLGLGLPESGFDYAYILQKFSILCQILWQGLVFCL